MEPTLHEKTEGLTTQNTVNTLPLPNSAPSSSDLARRAAIDQAIYKMLGLSEHCFDLKLQAGV